MSNTPREFIDAYVKAYEALDTEAFLALYADDARVFDAAEPAEYPTKEDWRQQVEAWFGSLEKDGEAECDFEEIELIQSGELAVINGHIEYEGTLAGTDEEVELEARATFVLQQFGDQWLIVHEHTSVPVEFDDEDDDDDDDHEGHDHDEDETHDHDEAVTDEAVSADDAVGSADDSVPTEAVNQ